MSAVPIAHTSQESKNSGDTQNFNQNASTN